jgi:hypothetical protein
MGQIGRRLAEKGSGLAVQQQQGPEQKALAERVRSALIECALATYTDAGVRGLCAEGAWEAAVTALRRLDLEPVCERREAPDEASPGTKPQP